MDFNDADPQRVFDVIPAGTIADAAADGAARQCRRGWSAAPFQGRQQRSARLRIRRGRRPVRQAQVLDAVHRSAARPEGHAEAAEISRSRLRAILESARGIRPDDKSETAKQARQIARLSATSTACASSAASVSSRRATITRRRTSCSTRSRRTARLAPRRAARQATAASRRRRPPPRPTPARSRGRHGQRADPARGRMAATGPPPQPLRPRGRSCAATTPIRMATPIGRLSDVEWGWIVAAIIFAWIARRAEQAAAEGLDAERTVRMTGYDPDPWDAGAVATILPESRRPPGVDWSKPLADWPREEMIAVSRRRRSRLVAARRWPLATAAATASRARQVAVLLAGVSRAMLDFNRANVSVSAAQSRDQ